MKKVLLSAAISATLGSYRFAIDGAECGFTDVLGGAATAVTSHPEKRWKSSISRTRTST